jgi:hypothetical protein
MIKKMKYKFSNESGGKKIFEEKIEDTELVVSVYKIGNGFPKMQIVREVKDSDGDFVFKKLGRMYLSEVEALIPVMEKVRKIMKKGR